MTLREYLDFEDMSITAFAERIGITRPAVSLWLAGRSMPRLHRIRQIENVTEGAVRAEDWIEGAQQ